MERERATAALYVVATPIGNLRDVSLRALDVLRSVRLVAAEDTRVTARLLGHHGIDVPTMPAHGHNERRAAVRVIETLASGQSVALVTDAGTPGLSDPGAEIVSAVRAAGYEVVPVPGASAAAALWSVSGFAGPQMLFYGFLPARAGERRRALEALVDLPFALLFYEAPHRVIECAQALAAVLGGERQVVIGRELTKLHESVHGTTLAQLADWLRADADRSRGEIALLVQGAQRARTADHQLGERLVRALADELPPAAAARVAARVSGVPRAALYALAVGQPGESGIIEPDGEQP